MIRVSRSIISALALVGLAAGTAQAIDPSDKCHSGKLKESAKYASCRLKAESKAILKMTAPDFSTCTTKFLSKFDAQETKAGPGICVTEGDGANIDARIAGDVSEIAVLLSGGSLPNCDPNAGPLQIPATGQTVTYRSGDDGAIQAGASLAYVDNGDGTVTDTNTGLVWEKLSDDGSIHDRDTVYDWDGAFDDKVAALNAATFAGYSDWRVPNVRELQSIVDYSVPYPGPMVAAAFNAGCTPGCTVTTCSCPASWYYWSSTTIALNPIYAWGVNFNDGLNGYTGKINPLGVRAVRGGS